MYQQLHGTGVALVTPFDSTNQIDYDGLKRLLKSTAEKGCDYYVVMGTTGESVTISPKEKGEILQFVKDNNQYSLPIVYGIGGNNTQAVIEEIGKTNLDGVDALLSVSPAYNKPSQEGIYQHFMKVADESPLPVILYNVPGRTGSNMSAGTTLRLAEHSNIIGVKEASGDLTQALHIVRDKPEDFMLISGDDILAMPLYSMGSVGAISVLANAFGDIYKSIKVAADNNDFKTATNEISRLLDINPLMYEQSNPVGIKYVLEKMGICSQFVRLPLAPADQALKLRLDEALDGLLVR